MKKNHIFSMLLGAASILSLASCYDDDSSLASGKLPDVTITTADDASTYYVSYLDELNITPTVNRGTAGDDEGLTYKWEITELPKDNSTEWIELGTDRDLHAVMNNDVSTQPYYLRYTVTDTKNAGLQYTKLWKVVIQSAFLDGIVVSDTKDGSTSDLNLIMSRNLTTNYGDKADKVTYGIIAKAQGSPFDKLMTSLTYNAQGNLSLTHVNNLWAVTADGDAVLFNTEKYEQTARLSEGGILTYRPDGIKALGVFSANGQFIFMNTNKYLYSINSTNASNFGWYDAAGSQYPISNGVVMTATSASVYDQCVMWYDAEHGKFVYSSGGNPVSYGDDLAANDFFNPSDMPGFTAIAAGQTTDGSTPAFVMKNSTTGNYSICTFVRYEAGEYEYDDDWNIIGTIKPEVPASARMRYDIPETGKALLDQAVSVFFAADQSILYVATPTGIYVLNFAGSSVIVNTTPVFTPAAGETIAKAKLYCQGAYMQDYSAVGNVDEGYVVPELPLNKKAVVVATQSDTYTGKISVVPMAQIGTGKLDASSALTYTGFGKILDFCATGY